MTFKAVPQTSVSPKLPEAAASPERAPITVRQGGALPLGSTSSSSYELANPTSSSSSQISTTPASPFHEVACNHARAPSAESSLSTQPSCTLLPHPSPSRAESIPIDGQGSGNVELSPAEPGSTDLDAHRQTLCAALEELPTKGLPTAPPLEQLRYSQELVLPEPPKALEGPVSLARSAINASRMQPTSRRYALMIGNSEYDPVLVGPYTPLPPAVKLDMLRMREELCYRGFDVERFGLDLNAAGMLRKLDSFVQAFKRRQEECSSRHERGASPQQAHEV